MLRSSPGILHFLVVGDGGTKQ